MLNLPRALYAMIVVGSMLAPPGASGQPAAVAAGQGSYAADVPDHAPQAMRDFASRQTFIDAGDRPIPTNDWWTDAIAQRWAGELWAHPLMARADQNGVAIFYPTRPTDDGRDLVREYPLLFAAESFAPTECRVTGWGDWSVDLRLPDDGGRAIDVTLAHGMPTVWLRYTAGLQPTLELPASVELRPTSVRLPGGAMARAMAFNHAERWWAVVMSPNSQAARDGDRVVFKLDPKHRFLAVTALPSSDFLDFYAQHAVVRPADTRFDWRYEPSASRVVTTWAITPDALLGRGTKALQGWLPHHLRETTRNFEPSQEAGSFTTIRGKLRLASGERFEITYPFEGVLPHWPMAARDNALAERTAYFTQGYAQERLRFATDTYWGGKDIWRATRYALAAHDYEMPVAETLFDAVRAELANWFTYTPGEDDRYFARYPKWGALVGVNPSYGSEGFNDHHFHYGYFLCAAGTLALHDPQFVADYGPMLRLLAENYAGWRRDGDLPRLRAFDPWAGHSWAGGLSSAGGNNQESSSEAMQGWAGLIFLGQALGDEQMTATGAMGYAIESRATLEYWFDWKQENWPATWEHGAVGMVWSGGQVYGTYFSGDPAWVYAIQWVPPSPILSYLARDPEAARRWLQTMWAERETKEGPGDAESIGPDLGNLILAYQALFDAPAVADQHARWFAEENKMAREHYVAGLVHLYAHHLAQLGRVDATCRTDWPTAAVYLDDAGARRLVAYNLGAKGAAVNVWAGDRRLHTAVVPARSRIVAQLPAE